MLRIKFMNPSRGIALRWMPQSIINPSTSTIALGEDRETSARQDEVGHNES